MIINIDDKKHLVLIPVNMSKEEFLLHAKVIKGSYFYKRLESIFIALTSSITNVEDEYKTYYSEYDSFDKYLYHKYPYLTDNIRASIIEKVKTKKYILLRGYMFELTDYNLQTIFTWGDNFSDDFKEKINKLLKAKLYEN
jgi:hypothetical protein